MASFFDDECAASGDDDDDDNDDECIVSAGSLRDFIVRTDDEDEDDDDDGEVTSRSDAKRSGAARKATVLPSPRVQRWRVRAKMELPSKAVAKRTRPTEKGVLATRRR